MRNCCFNRPLPSERAVFRIRRIKNSSPAPRKTYTNRTFCIYEKCKFSYILFAATRCCVFRRKNQHLVPKKCTQKVQIFSLKLLTFTEIPCIIVLSIIVLILSISVPVTEWGKICVGTEKTQFQPRAERGQDGQLYKIILRRA